MIIHLVLQQLQELSEALENAFAVSESTLDSRKRAWE